MSCGEAETRPYEEAASDVCMWVAPAGHVELDNTTFQFTLAEADI